MFVTQPGHRERSMNVHTSIESTAGTLSGSESQPRCRIIARRLRRSIDTYPEFLPNSGDRTTEERSSRNKCAPRSMKGRVELGSTLTRRLSSSAGWPSGCTVRSSLKPAASIEMSDHLICFQYVGQKDLQTVPRHHLL